MRHLTFFSLLTPTAAAKSAVTGRCLHVPAWKSPEVASNRGSWPLRRDWKSNTIAVMSFACGGLAGLYIYEVLTGHEYSAEWKFNWDGWKPPSVNDPAMAAFTVARHLILVRHGHYLVMSENHKLSDLGKKQADMTGKRLAHLLEKKNIRRIYHSDATRAEETAILISKYFPDVELKKDSQLTEGVPVLPQPPCRAWAGEDKSEEVRSDGPRISQAFERYFYCPDAPHATANKKDHPDSYEIIVAHVPY
eukprot:Filipodium_phascolosomae@DN2326_c0_g1_i4.p1